MRESESERVEFRLLGPIEAVLDGTKLELGGRRQRALLALLLIRPGRTVAADRLVEELWDGAAPGASTLRSYLSRLRTALGTDGLVASTAAGHLVNVPADRVDAHRFERLAREGHEALLAGTPRRAVDRLRASLGLWRGSPFGGAGDVAALVRERERLEEIRLLALEDRIEADLALGRSQDLVEELRALVDEHPFRERLWRHLMLALYRAGRQADALAEYERARSILREELGLDPGEELAALERSILRHEVPAVRAPERRHRLPAAVPTSVGREAELADIDGVLRGSRSVTLTGVGGAGKTRLALEVAARADAAMPDGVVFVDLSELIDPVLVPSHLAAALGGNDGSEVPLLEAITQRLHDAELLLVLDNCEHLRDACAEVVHGLLTACPLLRILTTSRIPLGVPGELEYLVPPLKVPAEDASTAELRSCEAVRLFLARATFARRDLTDDEPTLAAAARISRDLEGIPLALELAAARAKTLSLNDIASRLSDRYRFLISWRRLAPARHQTLREAMDWSYELLSEEERALLARLSVFSGGFTLEAVAVVCLDGDDEAALELVGHLVDASLIVAEVGDGGMRYRLLETVRQYAAERLPSAEGDVTLDLHAGYYLDLAERYSRGIYERGTLALAGLDPEDANLRASLVRSETTGSVERELRICSALWRYWWLRGEVAEGRRRLRAALEREPGTPTAARAEALRGASTLALRQGDHEEAAGLAEESLDVSRELGSLETARAQVALGNAVVSLGDDLDRGERLYAEGAATFRATGRTWELANVLLNMGDLALNRGDFASAERIASESLALNRLLGEDVGIALNLGNLAFAALERGQADRAYDFLAEAFDGPSLGGFGEWAAIMLVGLSAVLCVRGDDRRAAQLLGASNHLLEDAGASLDSIEGRIHARTATTLRERLSEDAFSKAVTEGRALTLSEAIDLAVMPAPVPLS
jgi:predicted ATPase/DNA-binding SARP family transcriptional activator